LPQIKKTKINHRIKQIKNKNKTQIKKTKTTDDHRLKNKNKTQINTD